MNVTKAEQFIGAYGQSYRAGVLIDHTDRFVEAGGTIRVGLHTVWALVPKMAAIPVVCGDIIEIATEDGPVSGRCGCNVVNDLGACAAHAEERQAWQALTEGERVAWERSNG